MLCFTTYILFRSREAKNLCKNKFRSYNASHAGCTARLDKARFISKVRSERNLEPGSVQQHYIYFGPSSTSLLSHLDSASYPRFTIQRSPQALKKWWNSIFAPAIADFDSGRAYYPTILIEIFYLKQNGSRPSPDSIERIEGEKHIAGIRR